MLILKLYAEDQELHMYYTASENSQVAATAFLKEHMLDPMNLGQLESWWGIVWSNKWGSGEKVKKHVLYQWYLCDDLLET
jgi:hypothetical protein